MLRLRTALAAALAIGMLAAPAVRAQTPSLPPPPYNVDLGALITNAARVAGTVTSAVQNNLANRGVLCKLLQTASSGSPSTTFAIQSYDAATLSWSTLATSGALTGYPGSAESTTGQSVLIYPGATLTSTPTGWVLNSLPLPRTWRVSQTIGSGSGAAGPAMSGKIGCNYLD